MKTSLVIFCVLSAAALGAADISDNTHTSFHHQTTRGTYHWHLSAERLLQTPEWNPETEPIPLAPDKACRLAGDWLKTHSFTNFVLEGVRIVRYDRTSLSPKGKQLAKRFYYKIEFTKPVEMIYAYVLLDGTVLEPTITPVEQRK
jgi:hypothetical protein